MLASVSLQVDGPHMKVMHVETGRHLYGGAQQVLYLCRGLLDRGVECTLVCPPGSEVEQAAGELKIPVRTVKCGGDLDLAFVLRLRTLLRELAPDIVHCHSRRGADLLGGRAAAWAAVPAVLSRRVDAIDTPLLASLRYRPYTRVVAISDNVAEAVLQSGLEPEKLLTIRSAVEPPEKSASCDEWRSGYGLAPDNVVGLVVAQLIERKGHEQLFAALPAFCRDHPEFHLLVFGQGPLESTLQKQVADLGLASCVSFAGFQNDLDQYMGCADLLIHPATQEGLGVAMLKASSAALPVLALNVAGAREVVVHKLTGLLTEPHDTPALLQALSELVENPRLREQLGAAGQQRMREEFSVAVMLDQHLALYESIIDAG